MKLCSSVSNLIANCRSRSQELSRSPPWRLKRKISRRSTTALLTNLSRASKKLPSIRKNSKISWRSSKKPRNNKQQCLCNKRPKMLDRHQQVQLMADLTSRLELWPVNIDLANHAPASTSKSCKAPTLRRVHYHLSLTSKMRVTVAKWASKWQQQTWCSKCRWLRIHTCKSLTSSSMIDLSSKRKIWLNVCRSCRKRAQHSALC